MPFIPLLAALVILVATSFAQANEAVGHEAVVRDWIRQDYMRVELPELLEREKERWRDEHLKAIESRFDGPGLKTLSCFVDTTGHVVEERMIRSVLAELESEADELNTLVAQDVPGADPRWRALYVRLCELRRAKRLEPLLARWTTFVFNQHRHVPNTWKYTEGLSDAQSFRFFKPGSSLNVLTMDGPYGTVRALLEDSGGVLRNPDVSHDGRRLLFAWKKSDRDDDYHLYEMELETGEVRQLTEGLGLADYEGIYLPDGNILFSSTRCIQTVDCNWTEVSNLYLMDGRGRYMRRVGFDQVHTIFPTLADDGRVLYTRWDYNDRAQIYTQPVFQMNTDGTSQREFYGGTSWFPTNLIHARKVPGSRKVLAVITGHHRAAHGKLCVIDPALGRQEGRGVQLIAPVRATEPIRIDKYALGGNQFQYPYPLDEKRFLVTLSLPQPDGSLGRFNIYCMDDSGRRELLVEGDQAGEGIGCRQVVPLAEREIPYIRPSQVDHRKTAGSFYVQDVYKGLGLPDVPRGTIKRLRVVALEFRAAGIGKTKQDGAGGSSNVSTPIAVGNASWDVKTVLGTATVYDDGSACFKAPARTPVYFQALDSRGQVVQTMRSWATLMPGENQACVGCHEYKNSGPSSSLGPSAAMRAGPHELLTMDGPPRGFSFVREIQPILDRHCLECHDIGAEPPCLSGETVVMQEMLRELSRSYLSLTHTTGSNGDHSHAMVNWIDSMSGPGMLPPYHRGAATSRLMTLLEDGHEGVYLSRLEREKIACWIDLLVPYCGDYLESNIWPPDQLALYARFTDKRRQQEELERENVRMLIEVSQGNEEP